MIAIGHPPSNRSKHRELRRTLHRLDHARAALAAAERRVAELEAELIRLDERRIAAIDLELLARDGAA